MDKFPIISLPAKILTHPQTTHRFSGLIPKQDRRELNRIFSLKNTFFSHLSLLDYFPTTTTTVFNYISI